MGYLSTFKFGSTLVKRPTLYDNTGNRAYSNPYPGGSPLPHTSGSTCKTGYSNKRAYNVTTRTYGSIYQCVQDP